MSPSGIVAAGSMKQYFVEAVRTALEVLRFQPNQETTAYLVELLCEYARAAAAMPDRPLAMVMAEARLADPVNAIHGFKRVGDQALYLAGYFSQSLLSKKLDPTYYVVLGSGAYRQLSRVLRRVAPRASASTADLGPARLVVVYRELGEDFARFAEVLSEVRCQCEPEGTPDRELGELYLQWLRTGSERARERLRAAGVLVLRRPGSTE